MHSIHSPAVAVAIAVLGCAVPAVADAGALEEQPAMVFKTIHIESPGLGQTTSLGAAGSISVGASTTAEADGDYVIWRHNFGSTGG